MPLRGKDRAQQVIRDKSDQLIRALALEAHGRLIRKTPVDQGRARNNWNVAVGEPDFETTDDEEYPKDGRDALQKGTAVIAGVRMGDVIYLTNALPYIDALDKGHSGQAPSGMVAVTKKELQPVVGQIIARIAAGGE